MAIASALNRKSAITGLSIDVEVLIQAGSVSESVPVPEGHAVSD